MLLRRRTDDAVAWGMHVRQHDAETATLCYLWSHQHNHGAVAASRVLGVPYGSILTPLIDRQVLDNAVTALRLRTQKGRFDSTVVVAALRVIHAACVQGKLTLDSRVIDTVVFTLRTHGEVHAGVAKVLGPGTSLATPTTGR